MTPFEIIRRAFLKHAHDALERNNDSPAPCSDYAVYMRGTIGALGRVESLDALTRLHWIDAQAALYEPDNARGESLVHYQDARAIARYNAQYTTAPLPLPKFDTDSLSDNWGAWLAERGYEPDSTFAMMAARPDMSKQERADIERMQAEYARAERRESVALYPDAARPRFSAFPDYDNGAQFDAMESALAPLGFIDSSWHNDGAPCLYAESHGVWVYVAYASDESLDLFQAHTESGECIADSNDAAQVVQAIKEHILQHANSEHGATS